MANRRHTYETFLLHSLLPAPGWQVVYWMEEQHVAWPVHALALVTRYLRDVYTQAQIQEYAQELEEDRRTIVGLEYNPSDGWTICDESGNYCGLLPPDWTMTDFEPHCAHPVQKDQG